MHQLVPAKDAAVRAVVMRRHSNQQRRADEPEEREEAVKGRLRAERVLPVKGGELAGEDEVSKARVVLPRLSCDVSAAASALAVQRSSGFLFFPLKPCA